MPCRVIIIRQGFFAFSISRYKLVLTNTNASHILEAVN